MAVAEKVPVARLCDRLVAVVSLALATALVHAAPLRFTLGLARVAKCIGLRPATLAEAERVVGARDWASRYFPSRAACLELSLAAYLASAAHGRAVDWCVGCRFHPCESHAWIEAAHTPVGEPDTPDRPFHVTLRI